MGNSRERLWLLAALKLGIRGLDYTMDQRVKLSAAEQKEISEAIHSILAEQTLSYTLDLQSRPEAKAEVVEHYHKSLEHRSRNPEAEQDNKLALFKAGVMKAAREKWGLPAKEPAPAESR